jgi:hypothetical protein
MNNFDEDHQVVQKIHHETTLAGSNTDNHEGQSSLLCGKMMGGDMYVLILLCCDILSTVSDVHHGKT